MRNEREVLLAVASAKEWKDWLKRYTSQGTRGNLDKCLFCKAYGRDCSRCKPGPFSPGMHLCLYASPEDSYQGAQRSETQMALAAYARLKAAGILPFSDFEIEGWDFN